MAQLSNTTIPDLSDGNERLDASLNSFLVPQSPLAHAQSLCKSLVEQIRIQFESSQREASELFETRQSLLLEKAKQPLTSTRRSFRMPHFISSRSLDASRLQRSIEQLESHIAHLLSSSLAATGTLLASTAEPLSTAFAALFAAPQPSDSFFFCLFASHKGVSSLGGLALPSSRALNDFDALLLSAFSPTPSVGSLTAGIHSRQLSNLDSAQSLSANTAEFLVSSVSETPVTEQDFSPLPAEPIDSPAGVSPAEGTEGIDSSPEIAPFFGKKVRVFQLHPPEHHTLELLQKQQYQEEHCNFDRQTFFRCVPFRIEFHRKSSGCHARHTVSECLAYRGPSYSVPSSTWILNTLITSTSGQQKRMEPSGWVGSLPPYRRMST